MANENLTVYQRLQQSFGAGTTRRINTPSYDLDPNNTIKRRIHTTKIRGSTNRFHEKSME